MDQNLQQQAQHVAMLRVGDIDPDPRQPRKKFDVMDEFALSVKAHGVHTAITVRPIPGSNRHMIIAGEKRWRAATEIHGLEYLIPAVIREAGDEEALKLATSENIDRSAMTPVEEAEAVDRVATDCGGDLDEVARQMGWKPHKVKQRIALMRAIPAVRAALTEEKILLGHAEILAAAPPALQEKALPRILEQKLTVDDVKQALSARTYVLAKAIFDKTECESCPNNTGIQKALFTTVLDAGRCTNQPCFDAKTEAALQAQATDLRETYPRVEILRLDNKVPVTTLEAEGPSGVGVDQAKACRACKDFGATLSGLPGEQGTVAKSQCFNLACNAEKRQALIEAKKPKPPEPAPAAPAAAPAAKGENTTQAPKGTAPKATTPAAPAAKPFNPKALRQAIIDHRKPIWQMALAKIALKDHALGMRLLVVLATSGQLRALPDDEYESAVGKELGVKGICKGKAVSGLQKVIEADESTTAKFLAGIVAASAEHVDAETLEQLLVASGKTLEDYWKVDKDFLEVLTKSEIDVVAKEIGLSAHMGDTYRSLTGKKKDEFIAALLGSGFEFARKVPSFMKWRS